VHAAHGSGSQMVIVSNEGRVILTLKSKSFSVHNKWYIFSGDSTNKDDKIATVKPHENSENAEVISMLLTALFLNAVIDACSAGNQPHAHNLCLHVHSMSR